MKEIDPPLTKKQRGWVLDRDEHKSQMRHYSEEKGWHTGGFCGDGCNNLHVHHITPRRMGGRSEPENLLTIHSCEHTGVCPERKIDE